MIDDLVQYCLTKHNCSSEDVEDFIEDGMDRDFNTSCDDGSIAEVSNLLFRFLSLLREGNVAQFLMEYDSLPVTSNQWLQQSPVQSNFCVRTSSNETDQVTEEDGGWITVQSTRRH